jgi:predicted nucleic acid-binding protein
VKLAADANVLLSALIGGRARDLIGSRDQDDVQLLALALCRHLTVWSNDSDFEDVGVEWATTAKLLKRLNSDSLSG